VSDPFFDTNIVIDWLRRRPEAARELAGYQKHRISRIAWSEILAGESEESRDRIKWMIRQFEVVELDERIAAVAADIRHRTRIKLLDAIILATAQVNGGVLVTRNTKDFPADLPGIRVPYTL
jgi:hypothetical protein